MNNYDNAPSKTGMPLFDKGGAESARYVRRLAVLATVVGGLALAGGAELKDTAGDMLYKMSTTEQLAKPYGQVQSEVSKGDFTPGSVIKVPLAEAGGLSAYADAQKLAPNGYYSSKVNDIENDIQAQQGNQPDPGVDAYLPVSDVTSRPAGSTVIK